MRFLTYNIRHAEGSDGWISNRRVAETIRDAAPDVVGLNEVWRLRGLWDQTQIIGDLLGMERVFVPNHERWIQAVGNAVLTRGQVIAAENLLLPGGIEQRGCLLVDVAIEGVRVAFASTHLSLGKQSRAEQIAFLAETLPSDRPLVLAGDLNCEVGELGLLGERLSVVETPKTFPTVRPRRALDHILFSHHWLLVSLVTLSSGASDHLPILVELGLR